jgi:hypothetical protein
MPSIAVPAPDWWNYKPLAREILMECVRGDFIDVDFNYMLPQGANPMSERVILDIEQKLYPREHDIYKLKESFSQRGFLNQVVPTSEPLHGVYYRNMRAGMLRYIPHYSFVGIDCFRFILATPWQTSDEFRVMINVVDGPYIRYYIYRKIGNPNAFKYRVKLFNREVKYIYYVWYEQIPRITYVGSERRPEIVIFPVKFLEGTVSANADGSFEILDSASETEWLIRHWPDPAVDGKGFVPGTDTIWRQPAGPYPFLVRCVGFDEVDVPAPNSFNPVDPLELWADSMQGGEYWWFRGPSIIWEP